MRKLITLTALGALLTTGAAMATQNQSAASKPPLTKAEMLARADARFTALDTNKDGQLSAEERQAGREGRKGRGGGERRLARVDTNGDGLISRAEHRAAAEARFDRMDANKDGTIERGERRHGKRGGMRMLMKADANKDGVVTRAEYDAASAARFERLDTNKDGKLDAADRPQRRATPPVAPAGS